MPKKKWYVLMPVLIAALALVVSGCGQKIAEKISEKAIEKATNGQAKVDIGTNSVTINTNGGSFQVGDKVSLPSGFPSDVYVIDGTIKSALTDAGTQGYTVSIEAAKSVTEAKDLYDQKLKDDGWTSTMSLVYQGSASLAAEKGDRTVNVTISESDGKTLVTLGTYKKTQ